MFGDLKGVTILIYERFLAKKFGNFHMAAEKHYFYEIDARGMVHLCIPDLSSVSKSLLFEQITEILKTVHFSTQ